MVESGAKLAPGIMLSKHKNIEKLSSRRDRYSKMQLTSSRAESGYKRVSQHRILSNEKVSQSHNLAITKPPAYEITHVPINDQDELFKPIQMKQVRNSMMPNLDSVESKYKQTALDYVTHNRNLLGGIKRNTNSVANLKPKHIRNISNVSDYSSVNLAVPNIIEKFTSRNRNAASYMEINSNFR